MFVYSRIQSEGIHPVTPLVLCDTTHVGCVVNSLHILRAEIDYCDVVRARYHEVKHPEAFLVRCGNSTIFDNLGMLNSNIDVPRL